MTALEQAHAACPCRARTAFCKAAWEIQCRCATGGEGTAPAECAWEGHARIDAAVAEAREEQRREDIEAIRDIGGSFALDGSEEVAVEAILRGGKEDGK